jgi:hypothetical protein
MIGTSLHLPTSKILESEESYRFRGDTQIQLAMTATDYFAKISYFVLKSRILLNFVSAIKYKIIIKAF